MADCKTMIDEVRFITKDEHLTEVYVAVSAFGDCPDFVRGWYHKTFPAHIPCQVIYADHFNDFLSWSRKAPD